MAQDTLFHGDNLAVLREHVADESVHLCCIDPPYHSLRDYRVRGSGEEGSVHAFTDRWNWGEDAAADWRELTVNPAGRKIPPTAVALLGGLLGLLGEGGFLAYLANLTLRLVEIHRGLHPRGTLYLHVDPGAAHYLKLVCDALFLPGGGQFRNEIVWAYESGGRGTRDFPWKHDTILRYTKSGKWTFDAAAVGVPRVTLRRNHLKREVDPDGRAFRSIRSAGKVYRYYDDEGALPSDVWTDVSHLHQRDPERVGYPTQKPEALLARIVSASSRPGDVVLDAYCGGGTTLAVAQKLGRRWVGIDRSAEAIAATRRRLATLVIPPGVAPADAPPDGPAATAGPTSG